MDRLQREILENKIYDISSRLLLLRQDDDEYMNMFGEIVEFMVENNSNSEMVDHILESWDVEDNDPDVTFLMALKSFVCSSDELKFLVERSQKLSGMRYMITQILEMNSFPQLVNVLTYAYQDKLSHDQYLDLKDYLNNYESKIRDQLTHVYSFIEEKLKAKQKKPSWVTLKESENIGFLDTVSIGYDLDEVNVVLNQIKKDLNNFNVEEDALSLFASSISDTINLDQSYDQSFRVWGPENRFIDRECIGNPETRGGCRMLRCICHEDESEWFTGKCDHCEKIIDNISFSVRYPKKLGGWVGCYCSFKCMSDYPPEDMRSEENAKVKSIESKIKEIGIMDRSVN